MKRKKTLFAYRIVIEISKQLKTTFFGNDE